MVNKKNRFPIQDSELAEWFSLTVERLKEIIDSLDSEPNKKWNLLEKKDYIFISKSTKTRNFSDQGALKIATYLDKYEKRGLLYKIKELITRHDAKVRGSLAQKIITTELNDQGKIIFYRGKPMIYKQSVRRILETNGWKLNQTLEQIQHSNDILELDVDFAEIDQKLWFAESGFVRISKQMSNTLTNSVRREKVKIIGKEFIKTFHFLVEENDKLKQQKEIENIKKRIKKREGKCQITGRTPSKDKINLAVHHLFCTQTHPHLSTTEHNLITIDENIHKEFHATLGGFQSPCTIDDFIEFISYHYPDHSPALIIRLNKAKAILDK